MLPPPYDVPPHNEEVKDTLALVYTTFIQNVQFKICWYTAHTKTNTATSDAQSKSTNILFYSLITTP